MNNIHLGKGLGIKNFLYTEKIAKEIAENPDNLAVYFVELDSSLNKISLKKFFADLLQVTVSKISINIWNIKGKMKSYKGKVGKQSDKKKARILIKN